MRFALLLGIGIVAIGCSSSASGSGPSTLQGTAALTTFPSAPTAVRVQNETGQSTTAPIAADGSFSTTLPKGHTYKIAFVTASGEIPLVYPRQTGKLDAAFAVRSNGARVQLGAVHHLASAPPTGFKALASSQPTHDDEVDDDQKVSCEDGKDGADDTESADSGEQADGSKELAVGERNAPEQVDGCDAAETENEQDGKGN